MYLSVSAPFSVSLHDPSSIVLLLILFPPRWVLLCSQKYSQGEMVRFLFYPKIIRCFEYGREFLTHAVVDFTAWRAQVKAHVSLTTSRHSVKRPYAVRVSPIYLERDFFVVIFCYQFTSDLESNLKGLIV